MIVALELVKVYWAQGKSKKAENKLRSVLRSGQAHAKTTHESYAAANRILGEILLGKDQDKEVLRYLNSAYLSNTTKQKIQIQAADNIENVLMKTNQYEEAITFRKEERLNSVQEKYFKAVAASNTKISEVFAV